MIEVALFVHSKVLMSIQSLDHACIEVILLTHRQAEEVFVEERDSEAPGHEWERVARLCDFNPKNNKNTKDVSRMRSMFLQLKQSPPVH